MLRSIVGLSVFSGVLSGLPSLAHAELREIPLTAVMAPAFGYDNNDRIEIVAYGQLPNACHTLAETEVLYDAPTKTFKVKQFANRKRDGLCAEDRTIPAQMNVAAPFTSQFQIRDRWVSIGEFSLAFVNREGTTITRRLLIAGAKATTQDEVPYATISSLMVTPIVKRGQNARITLTGVTTSTCFVRNAWNVESVGDVLVVRPTLTYLQNRMCLQVLTPFEETLEVPADSLTPGYHLVHVRSTGRSVNEVIEVGAP